VRSKLWSYLTQDEEGAAHARLKRHLFGAPRERVGGLGRAMEVRAAVAARPALSDDGLLVREVRGALARTGFRGDPFYALKSQRPDWTRDRWETAVAEIEGTLAGGRRGFLTARRSFGSAGSDVVSASEIASHIYCPEQWRPQALGNPSENAESLER